MSPSIHTMKLSIAPKAYLAYIKIGCRTQRNRFASGPRPAGERTMSQRTTRTYKGSCHCGQIAYEADIDLAQGTGKCNCTFCTKARAWKTFVKPNSFRLLSGSDRAIGYRKHPQGVVEIFLQCVRRQNPRARQRGLHGWRFRRRLRRHS